MLVINLNQPYVGVSTRNFPISFLVHKNEANIQPGQVETGLGHL